MKPSSKLNTWRIYQSATEDERDRINYLKTAPLPVNDPLIMRPIKVQALTTSFCVKGQQVQLNSILMMSYFDAYSLWVTGKVAFLE